MLFVSTLCHWKYERGEHEGLRIKINAFFGIMDWK